MRSISANAKGSSSGCTAIAPEFAADSKELVPVESVAGADRIPADSSGAKDDRKSETASPFWLSGSPGMGFEYCEEPGRFSGDRGTDDVRASLPSQVALRARGRAFRTLTIRGGG